MDIKQLGKYGEDCAAAELEKRGYQILARNWRCPLGEIDILAQHEDELVAVEVKTRRGRQAADRALLSFDEAKQAKLRQLVEFYHAQLDRNELGLRVDLVSVEVTAEGVFMQVFRGAVGW